MQLIHDAEHDRAHALGLDHDHDHSSSTYTPSEEVLERIDKAAKATGVTGPTRRRTLTGMAAALGGTLAGLGFLGPRPATAAAAEVRAAEGTKVSNFAASALAGSRTIRDLSHTFGNDFPVYTPYVLLPNMQQSAHFDVDGFNAMKLDIDEHTGTHMDAPAHFSTDPAAWHSDEIPVNNLVAELCVIRIADRAYNNPEALVTADDLRRHESRYGTIPRGSIVAMDSGWCGRVTRPGAFIIRDSDGNPHFPGFGFDAAELMLQRQVAGAASDTPSLDSGANSHNPGAHRQLLPANKYGIEGANNLHTVPDRGAVAIVGTTKHKGGFGGPTRLIAVY
ncbi:cyclase family protein [Kitasatospora sp. NPDC101801]|uniref:cyclase family protein n=1 Tax=Kitasatospora sp. NPDC101801 TaxID=3364103 RepID=UPI0037F71761